MKRSLFIAISIALYLVGCNGNAPLLTCRAPCEKSYEYRDLFCGCQDGRNTGRWPPPPPPPPPGEPSLEWVWEASDDCPSNRHYYLINPSSTRWIVEVNWKVRGSLNRDSREYTIDANVTDRKYGIDLGLEEEPVPGDFCFDKYFMIGTKRQARYGNAIESSFAQLAESASQMKSQHAAILSPLQTEKHSLLKEGTSDKSPTAEVHFYPDALPRYSIRSQVVRNCQEICDSGDTLNCAIRGFPPDQEKLRSVVDRLRDPVVKHEYSAADIYSIFNLPKSACYRDDARVVGNKVFNTGKYCSYPMLLRESDTAPVMAIHFPEAVRAQKVGDARVGGLLFDLPSAMPILIFANVEMNGDFGGVITDATASDKGVYYQTTTTCIFMGLR